MEALSVPIYHLLKSVQGNFNKGSVALFGETAGKQFVLFSVYWSVDRNLFIWKSYHVDNILTEGDKIYKFLN